MGATRDTETLDALARLRARRDRLQAAYDRNLETGEEYQIESGAARRRTRKTPLSVLSAELEKVERDIAILEGQGDRPVFVQAAPDLRS